MNAKLISIVVPIFNEEKNLPVFFHELKSAFKNIDNFSFEIIFVNDGSQDGSLIELNNLASEDSRIKVVSFSRNFGKEAALSAGCFYAEGEAVITLDSDLQHPPEKIPELIKKWQEGFEVVYTVRIEQEGVSLMKKITSKIYWWIFSHISSTNSEPNSTDFRLMDKKVAKQFRQFPERGRIFRGIIDWMGYRRVRIEFISPQRKKGKAGYSYRKLISLAINSLTAFSLLPLKIAGYLGMIITFFSGILLVFMLAARWFYNSAIFSSLAFVVIFNTLLIGIVLICLGLIALYIARIHDEVVDRPLYIIQEKINIKEEKDGKSK